MRRLLLVSHRPVSGAGGAVARWRSLAARLPSEGWTVDVVSSDESPAEFDPQASSARRAGLMRPARSIAAPALAVLGLRPAALTPSTAWAFRAARRVRAQLATDAYDAMLATGPPVAGPLAARLGGAGSQVPLVVEFRDLWAGNPAYEQRPGALDRIERMLLASVAAVVAVTEEAAESLRRRHSGLAERVSVIPNGYEPELLGRRSMRQEAGRRPIVLLHSGTLIPGRPLAPLVAALGRRPAGEFRLVLHGYIAPELQREVEGVASIDVLPPSSWTEAVERMRAADVCVITQSRAVGDATAIPGKVYEYLALGRPVLCISDGGATEQLLRRLGADTLLARLDDPASIDNALGRIFAGRLPPPVDPSLLASYSRAVEAGELARLLDGIVAR